jgi:hypothetical protein
METDPALWKMISEFATRIMGFDSNDATSVRRGVGSIQHQFGKQAPRFFDGRPAAIATLSPSPSAACIALEP